LPATVGGDVVRVWECYRSGMDVAKSIHSVVLDRATYLLPLSFLAPACLSIWGADRLPGGSVLTLWFVFAGALTLAAALAFLDRFPVWILPPLVRRRAVPLAE